MTYYRRVVFPGAIEACARGPVHFVKYQRDETLTETAGWAIGFWIPPDDEHFTVLRYYSFRDDMERGWRLVLNGASASEIIGHE